MEVIAFHHIADNAQGTLGPSLVYCSLQPRAMYSLAAKAILARKSSRVNSHE